MAWPTAADYQKSLQNPSANFIDSELQAGTVQPDERGLPRYTTGDISVVFVVRSASPFAVKCFIKPVPDLEARYRAIAQHLAQQPVPALIPFTFSAQGIRVGRKMYPILKMECAAGDPLDQFVDNNLNFPGILQTFLLNWRRVLMEFRMAGIAHCDLQPAHITVKEQDIQMLDYDRMYVPALRGNPPEQQPDRAFQHPRRSQNLYDENGDNFAALVVYLSVLAVSNDPGLWTIFHSPTTLLFSADDLNKPRQTLIWRRLHESSNREVRRLTDCLLGYLSSPPNALPPLEATLANAWQVNPVIDWDSPLPVVPSSPERPIDPDDVEEQGQPNRGSPPNTWSARLGRFILPASILVTVAFLLAGLWWLLPRSGSVAAPAPPPTVVAVQPSPIPPTNTPMAAVTPSAPPSLSADVQINAAKQRVEEFLRRRRDAYSKLDGAGLEQILTGDALERQLELLAALRVADCRWELQELEPVLFNRAQLSGNTVEVSITIREQGRKLCNGVEQARTSTWGDILILEQVDGLWYISNANFGAGWLR